MFAQPFYIVFVDAVNKKILLTKETLSHQWISFECRIESKDGAADLVAEPPIVTLEVSRWAKLLIRGVPKSIVVSGQPVALFSVHASDMKRFHQIKLRAVQWFGPKDPIKMMSVDKLCQKIMRYVFKRSRKSIQAFSNDVRIVLQDKSEREPMEPDPSIAMSAGSGVLVARVHLRRDAPTAVYEQAAPIRNVSPGSSGVKLVMTNHADLKSALRGITKQNIEYIISTAVPVEMNDEMLRFEYDGTTVIARQTGKDEKRYCIITVYGRSDGIPNPDAATYLLPEAKNRRQHHKKYRDRIQYMKIVPRERNGGKKPVVHATGEQPHVETVPVTQAQDSAGEEEDSLERLPSDAPPSRD